MGSINIFKIITITLVIIMSCNNNGKSDQPKQVQPPVNKKKVEIDTYNYNYIKKLRGARKKDDDVFKRWMDIQKILTDISMATHKDYLDNDYVKNFKKTIPTNIQNQLGFLGMSFNEIDSNKSKFLNKMKSVFEQMDEDFPEFIKELVNSNFTGSKQYKIDKSLTNSKAREKYNLFMEALFYHDKFMTQRRSLFAFANRLFEFAFNPKTYSQFKKIVKNKKNLPLVHLFHEGIWYYLARTGWKYWHQSTLDNLARLSRQGKKVVYIAGGSDIYQLICNGVYNIRIIDPIFPSQTKYYSEGWDFLIKSDKKNGGLGDRIYFKNGKKKIKLVRVYFKKGKVFSTDTLSNGKKMKIPSSKTVWEIRDMSDNKLGEYILERRFVKQSDFKVSEEKVFLISFNELNFITTIHRNNWGIKPKLFDPSFQFYVKQLRNPVTYKMMQNIQNIQKAYWGFIFGSSID